MTSCTRLSDLVFIDNYDLNLVSSQKSSTAPEFKITGVEVGDIVSLYKDADSNCENGTLLDEVTVTDGNLQPTLVAQNLGLSQKYKSFRAKIVTRLTKKVVCTKIITYEFNVDSKYIHSSLGQNHSCALTDLKTVRCWGYNYYGQLGTGNTVSSLKSVEVLGIPAVKQVASGGNHVCAVTDVGGRVYCWGQNTYGQVGNGDNSGQNVLIPVDIGLTNVAEVTAGLFHTCARLNTGAVKCWGRNIDRQLGDGTDITRYSPVDVIGLSGAALQIGAGYWNNCAVIAGSPKTVQCWGFNYFGELGRGSASPTGEAPANFTGLTANPVAVSLGDGHTCVLQDDGTIVCVGKNGLGQLGRGTGGLGGWADSEYNVLPVSGITNAIKMSSGQSFNCAVLADKTVKCWGGNALMQLGDSTVTNRLTPIVVPHLSSIASISSGFNHSCVIDDDSVNRCWGLNSEGQLGDGATQVRMQAQVVAGLSGVKSMGVGVNHTCVVLSDKSIECWGDNTNGQLGDGTNTSRTSRAKVLGITNATVVVSSDKYSCALLESAEVKCWGVNDKGQIGSGDLVDHNVPVLVGTINNAIAVSLGHKHSCALLSTGTMKCWGYNWQGALGNNTTIDSSTPVDVLGLSSISEIALGDYFSCARISGEVKCWGANWGYRLGIGDGAPRTQPDISIVGINNAISIVASGAHGCVILATGPVKCWGGNQAGALGDGTEVSVAVPSAVLNVSSITKVFANGNRGCALSSDKTLKCWGGNTFGQLGNGHLIKTLNPGLVLNLSQVQDVSLGAYHSCAILTDKTVKCWGYNSLGQLGFVTESPTLVLE